MPEHIVAQGDCTLNIAKRYGHFWETIWNHPENAALKSKRRENPNVLFPGDRVFVPEIQPKHEAAATDQRHRFRRKGFPAKLRLRLLDDEDQPRANEPYELIVNKTVMAGNTNAEGRLEHFIPPDATEAKLILQKSHEEYDLDLGYVDPVDEISGIQARLENLGYYSGPRDGALSEETRGALKAFQENYGLPETGQPDADTKQKLIDHHGS